MRTLIFISVLTTFLGCTPKDLPTQVLMNEELIEVKLSYMSTKDELQNVQSQLSIQYDIDFNFKNSTFFEDGKLRDLNLKVTLPNGTIGKTSAMYAILETKYVGLRINLKEGAMTPIEMGTIY
jgi:hypothetical protein